MRVNSAMQVHASTVVSPIPSADSIVPCHVAEIASRTVGNSVTTAMPRAAMAATASACARAAPLVPPQDLLASAATGVWKMGNSVTTATSRWVTDATHRAVSKLAGAVMPLGAASQQPSVAMVSVDVMSSVTTAISRWVTDAMPRATSSPAGGTMAQADSASREQRPVAMVSVDAMSSVTTAIA